MRGWFSSTRDLLEKYAKGKIVLALLLITWAVYAYMLSTTIPLVMRYAHGLKLLDMQPMGYTVEYARTLFTNLGAAGRDAYLFKQIPVDMFYPFLFALSYSLLLTYLFRKSFRPESKMHNLALVPIFAGVFDYLENIGIIYHLQSYPQLSDSMIRLTSVFSMLKSIFTMIFFVLLFVGLGGILMKRFGKSLP